MKIIPHTKEEWLAFVLLPLKAYTVIGPLMFITVASLPHPPHTGATYAEGYVVVGLFPCSLLLLFTALVLAIVGPKGTALPCAVFGAAAFIVGYSLLPRLAS